MCVIFLWNLITAQIDFFFFCLLPKDVSGDFFFLRTTLISEARNVKIVLLKERQYSQRTLE